MRGWIVATIVAVIVSAVTIVACGPCSGDPANIDLEIQSAVYVEAHDQDVLDQERVAINRDDVVITYVGEDGVEYRVVYAVEANEFRE